MDTAILKQIESQIQSDRKIQLDAGFGVLLKDYARYLEEHPREDAGLFQEIYADFEQEETESYGGSPFFRPAEEVGLPRGFAEQAGDGVFRLSPLTDAAIVHEWTSIPGQRLLRRFAAEFRNVICGPGGPYEQFQKDLVGQASLPAAIASSVLTAGFSAATFWYPVAIYIGLLIVKAGLATYCKSGEVGHVG